MKRRKYTKSRRVNQVYVEFTSKPITAWGGIASVIAKFLEEIGFREWGEGHVPIEERSNNAKGVYPKVLAQFLTALVGGHRFGHLSWWGHGIEAIKKSFGVEWLPTVGSVLTRFWNKLSTQGAAERWAGSARHLAASRR